MKTIDKCQVSNMPLTCGDSFSRELHSLISAVYPMKQYRFECPAGPGG